MKKTRLFLGVLVFTFLLSTMSFANGLNLNSLGSRAQAMGGAFIGLADDFSTIFWNPAGMAMFEKKHFGFYGTDLIPKGEYNLDMSALIPGYTIDAETESKHYLAGMGAYYHPLGDNLVAGIGVYTPSGLGASWDGSDLALISGDPTIDWRSKIGMISIAPAIAYKISDAIAIGATLNINYGMFDIAMHAGGSGAANLEQYEESLNGWGYGATFGVLVKPCEMVSIGATYRTATTIKFSGEATISNIGILSMDPTSPFYGVTIDTTSDAEREVTWPMFIGGGVAVKPVDGLTVTTDLQWTQWSKIDELKATYTDPIWSIFMQAQGEDVRPMHWGNAMQIRFGAEYAMKSLAFRAGYYIDPAPAPDKTMNILLPNFDFSVICLGFGYSLNGLNIDVGFEYLMGKERTINPLDPEMAEAMPGTHNMNILVPSISVGYRF
ncbi:MAG: OmpP1/FadL family transporter [Candidatus Aminicenantaceae bacterium]